MVEKPPAHSFPLNTERVKISIMRAHQRLQEELFKKLVAQLCLVMTRIVVGGLFSMLGKMRRKMKREHMYGSSGMNLLKP